MKKTLKLVPLLLILFSLFTSCRKYEITHHDRSELEKLSPGFAKYKVYIHDKDSTYKIENVSLTPAGIKGNPISITDPAQVEEIKDPHTAKQLRKHKDDVVLYTKTELKNSSSSVLLKKENITDVALVAHKESKVNLALYGEILALAAVGTLVWIGIIASTQGLL